MASNSKGILTHSPDVAKLIIEVWDYEPETIEPKNVYSTISMMCPWS